MEHRVQHGNDDQRQYRREAEPKHDGRGHALSHRGRKTIRIATSWAIPVFSVGTGVGHLAPGLLIFQGLQIVVINLPE